MKIWHQYPFVRLLLPFVCGIVTAIYLNFQFHFLIIPVIITLGIVYGTLVFFMSQKIGYSRRWIPGALILMFLTFAGYEYTILRTDSFQRDNISRFVNSGPEIMIRIDEPVTERPGSYKVIALPIMIKDSLIWRHTSGKIILYFQKDTSVQRIKYGDLLIIKTRLNEIRPPMNPGEFNYKQYLSNKGIYNQGYVKEGDWFILGHHQGHPFRAFGIHLRQILMKILSDQHIQGQEYAVASAILLGYDGFLEPDQVKEFSGAGAMHILCVSGLHVGIIYLILNFLLGILNKKKGTRMVKVLLLLLLIWLYALITGLSPSVMRASLMFSFVATGGLLSRKTNIYNTLSASAFVLLLIDPYMITDVGFQLSYLAVFGIVWLYKPLSVLAVPKNIVLRNIWQISVVSFAATLMTFPISLFYFHQFPNLFLVTNLIAIPASTLIIYAGILVLATSFIPAISLFLAEILTLIITVLNYSVETIEGQSFSVLRGIYINSMEMILLFSLIFPLALFFFIRRKTYLFITLGIMVILMASFGFRRLLNLNDKKIAVYCINKTTAIDFINGKESLLLADSIIKSDANKIGYHIQNHRMISGVKPVAEVIPLEKDIKTPNFLKRGNFIRFFGKSLVLIDPNSKYYPLVEKLPVNYLLLTHNAPVTIKQLSETFDFELVIIDHSNAFWRADQWVDECEQSGIQFHLVTDKGAWIEKI